MKVFHSHEGVKRETFAVVLAAVDDVAVLGGRVETVSEGGRPLCPPSDPDAGSVLVDAAEVFDLADRIERTDDCDGDVLICL